MVDDLTPDNTAAAEAIDQTYIDRLAAKFENDINLKKFRDAIAGLEKLARDYPAAPDHLKTNYTAFFDRRTREMRSALQAEDIIMGDAANRETAEQIANRIATMYKTKAGYKAQEHRRIVG